jgi:hypothetical protein
MTANQCPWFSGLAKLVLGKYGARDKLLSTNCEAAELRKAELDIARVQKLVTRHRLRCPHCKAFNTIAPLGGFKLRLADISEKTH